MTAIESLSALAPLHNPARNTSGAAVRVISPDHARVTVCVIPTDEEHALTQQTSRLLNLTTASGP